MKNLIYTLFLTVCIFFSCNDIEKEKQKVLETDINFSNLSEKEGMKNAFLTFADKNAVLLRNNSYPIKSKENIGKSFADLNDSTFQLIWEPLNVYLSKSVDLGYTYGIYTLTYKNDTSITKGTYLSIWKKQKDGNRKWILDTGNEGLK